MGKVEGGRDDDINSRARIFVTESALADESLTLICEDWQDN